MYLYNVYIYNVYCIYNRLILVELIGARAPARTTRSSNPGAGRLVEMKFPMNKPMTNM